MSSETRRPPTQVDASKSVTNRKGKDKAENSRLTCHNEDERRDDVPLPSEGHEDAEGAPCPPEKTESGVLVRRLIRQEKRMCKLEISYWPSKKTRKRKGRIEGRKGSGRRTCMSASEGREDESDQLSDS
jgi:hypothetical protein